MWYSDSMNQRILLCSSKQLSWVVFIAIHAGLQKIAPGHPPSLSLSSEWIGYLTWERGGLVQSDNLVCFPCLIFFYVYCNFHNVLLTVYATTMYHHNVPRFMPLFLHQPMKYITTSTQSVLLFIYIISRLHNVFVFLSLLLLYPPTFTTSSCLYIIRHYQFSHHSSNFFHEL